VLCHGSAAASASAAAPLLVVHAGSDVHALEAEEDARGRTHLRFDDGEDNELWACARGHDGRRALVGYPAKMCRLFSSWSPNHSRRTKTMENGI
jgi:hypothetical protein